ncbi:histidine kinase [Bradyrhizobium sp. SZCCHNS2096]|uniref:phosphorylase family protein n=1 Tax=Bradyrhizobium sp. SZCCHNS2096 TaxID=3057309 RepID=UPI0029169AE9|nr:histidine kinase [Bradyrhizobium sp. SZCCHNS2096]
MISVLVVEDDNQKFGRIHATLVGAGVAAEDICHAITSSQALDRMARKEFDLLLLDVNLPRRLGENPIRGGGAQLLFDVHRDGSIRPPRYIVGLTAFEDVVHEFGEKFSDLLWTLVFYSDNSNQWIGQIAAKVAYIRAAKGSKNFTDGATYGVDLAVVCALDGLELTAVRAMPCGWQPLRMERDETRYISGAISDGKEAFSVVAAAAPRMGMPASAVLTSKIIAQFRPRLVVMTGICAGRVGKADLGDVIVADPCWDWGSGKIDSVNDVPEFRPAPHQVELDTDLGALMKEVCADVGMLARVKAEAVGTKPPHELQVHFGPLASGAAVVANSNVFNLLLQQHRNLLAIEMEAYGVVLACKGSGKPRPLSLIMKSVCDFADKDKVDDFQEYAAHTSTLLLHKIAPKILRHLYTS